MGCLKLPYLKKFEVTKNYFKKELSSKNSSKNDYSYLLYGKILRKYNPDDEKYLTTQHQRDEETGFDYRGARFYDSDVARFLSVDPWADKYPQWSTYNYVVANPIVYTDPTGKGPNATVTVGYILEGFRQMFQAGAQAIDNFKAELSTAFTTQQKKVGPISTGTEVKTTTTVGSNLTDYLNVTHDNKPGAGSMLQIKTKTTVSQITKVKATGNIRGVDVTLSNTAKVNLANGDVSNVAEVTAGKGDSGAFIKNTTTENSSTTQIGVKATVKKQITPTSSFSISTKLYYEIKD